MIYLSIIIPTRNRAYYLSDLLKSLSDLEFPNEEYEILIIDNASTDNTNEIYKQYKTIIPNIRYLYQKKIGLHQGRNLGLIEAKGEILCYLDDDVYLFKGWMQGIIESFKDKTIVLVGGKNLPKYENIVPDWIENLWKKEKNIGYLSILDLGDEGKEIDPFLVYGCNFSIRKKILMEAGGFHPDGFPQSLIKYRGDGESYVSSYIKNNNYKTFYSPAVSVYHAVSKERLTEKYFKKRAFNQGISDSFTQIRTFNGNKYLIIKSLIRNILHFSISVIFSFDKSSKNFRREHIRGCIYHHVYCLFDANLLKYVLKINYLDE